MGKTNQVEIVEYIIVGGGPAAICAIPNILNTGVSGKDIVWIDPVFKVGDFGTILSVGSSVPGNTSVESYQKVNNTIYKMMPACAPKKHQIFEIDSLNSNFVCSLKIAAKPLQHISDKLRKMVSSIEGKVLNIFTVNEGLKLEIKLSDGNAVSVIAKRVILALGARAKTLKLPTLHNEIVMIDPNIAFIESELAEYLRKNPQITTVAVIGSSHSAALATMHLLKAGLTVKQFMDKEYKYAAPCIASDGTKYTKYDNIGLKGNVAKFTKQLIEDINLDKGEYKNKLIRYIARNRQEVTRLLEKHLFDCSHVIAAIGYETSPTLQINNLPLSQFQHDSKSTGFKGVSGLFGIGVAFPQLVKAISGEVEFAVGIEKFWTTTSKPDVLEFWKTNIAKITSCTKQVVYSSTDLMIKKGLFKQNIQEQQQKCESEIMSIRARL